MIERIIWIDWAKALAVTTVVFCHLPQSQECFYYRYLQAVIIVIFFFLSGYLKKNRTSEKENWKKYWHGLIVPYIIYNAIVYPYWLVKYYMYYGGLPDLLSALKPVFGALLFEHENAFCEPLNGPLWYLPAILMMHVMIDLSRKTKYMHVIMITLSVLSVFLYAANKYWYYAPNLTPMGLMRNLPYYYIGYVMGQNKLFRTVRPCRDFFSSIICFSASILLFSWHLHAFFTGQYILHIILFYPVNIGFLFGVLYGCKLINGIVATRSQTYRPKRFSFVTNLSIGTLVIIGLHIVLITIANFMLEQSLMLNVPICYHWYEALPIAIVIVAILYPIIIFSKRYCPILLGKTDRQINN